MNNYPIDEALVTAEGTFEIDLLNKITGVNFPNVPVTATNTLIQILGEYALDIGVNPNANKILYENKRTGATTSDGNETVAGLDLIEGDVLAISDDAPVA